jgi:hypothetical protein
MMMMMMMMILVMPTMISMMIVLMMYHKYHIRHDDASVSLLGMQTRMISVHYVIRIIVVQATMVSLSDDWILRE